MNARPLRLAGLSLVTATLAASVLSPSDAQEPLVLAIAGGGSLVGLLLFADWRIGRWLARPSSSGKGPGHFLRDEGLTLLAGAAGLALAHLSSPALRRGDGMILWVALAAFAVAAAALALKALLAVLAPRGEIAELAALAPMRPLSAIREEAREFEHTTAVRITGPILQLVGAGALVALVCIALGAGLYVLGLLSKDVLAPGLRFGETPLLSRLGIMLAVALLGVALATSMLGALRVVDAARATGRVPREGIWRQWGRALETVGFLGTALYALVLAAVTALVALLPFEALRLWGGGWDEGLRLGIGAAGAALLVWLFVLVPHLFMLPLFLKHECSWADALEASAILVTLEPRRSLALAAAVTLRFLTVVRLPGALLLIDLALDGRDELVAAVLHEKPVRLAREALTTAPQTRGSALAKPYQLLEAGRYLDALNQFQLHRRRNREDVEALRGESLALLALGNVRQAREKLEWWCRLDPDNHEPAAILAEVEAGRWDPGGDLRAEADLRATQRITGRGY